MHIQDMSSGGSSIDDKLPSAVRLRPSTSLPFGKNLPLSSISGPTYLTAQTLVQQVAYALSDKLFSYSPDSFDLNAAARDWESAKDSNIYGYTPSVHPMQIRDGAGSIALGYMFSKDFDLKKRHIPQGLIASSSALRFLQPVLDQLSLLYSVSNPFVAHVAAVDYDGSKDGRLVSDYATPMRLADDLGFALVSTQSTHEAQHMALYSTLLAHSMPVLHIYDGNRVGRDTTRVIDVADKTALGRAYTSVLHNTSPDTQKHLSAEGKASHSLKALNEELGTDYKCFEYSGHEAPEATLVTFGSIESSIAKQVATAAAKSGTAVGVISVRVYRPFLEDEFLKLVPQSAKAVSVLGQVTDSQEVAESGIHSPLYEDVLAALISARTSSALPAVRDLKYARSKNWTVKKIWEIFRSLQGTSESDLIASLPHESGAQQYIFWDTDDSSSAQAPVYFAQALAKDSSQNVVMNTVQDNLIQGGSRRIDVRISSKSLDSSYPVTDANIAVVANVKLLEDIDVLASLRINGKLILVLPGLKEEDLEKKLPASFRKSSVERNIELYLVDPEKATFGQDRPDLYCFILQAALVRAMHPETSNGLLQKLSATTSDIHTLEKISDDLESTMQTFQVPKSWLETEAEKETKILSTSLSSNSFEPFDKTEDEPPSLLRNWQKAAKGLLFKEAYEAKPSLRPDLPQKTYTIHVKENRRLTPLTYDRNIFHVEFDLGQSGLKYDIGEALGIHAENDHDQVMKFLNWYGANPDDVVELAARDNQDVFENRTIYQSLMQNIDIFGRPPKKFYESLADFATDPNEKKNLLTLAGPEGFKEFQRRAEVDTVTYTDVLQEFPSARPSFHDLARIVAPMKRREYSIASCQAVTPTSIALMVVVVNWTDPRGRDRFGQATRYLSLLRPGAPITVSVKPSVMKLPSKSTQPLIMAGLGTGLAPFRAFVQHRAMEKAAGKEIGDVLLYMGSRHQREEYCYGEEWEAYQRAGVITLLGRAFSRDQPKKIYIQDRMRETLDRIVQAYVREEGVFYLCGPTWPVPDVTAVLEQALGRGWEEQQQQQQIQGTEKKMKKFDGAREIMKLKDEGRYVLEVY